MQKFSFTLTEDYIELIKLLKVMNFAESGSHAKYLVDCGNIIVNQKVELRKRCKIRKGDCVIFRDKTIKIK